MNSSKHTSIMFGIQGGRGSFNEQAILKYIHENQISDYAINYLYTSTKVMQAIKNKSINFGICAIHNKLGGLVDETINALANYSIKIVDQVQISITHHLMKRKDIDTSQVNQIMAHPQVLKQCSQTLNYKYPNLICQSGIDDLIDTARAAQALALEQLPKETAILGPEGLAQLYDFEFIDHDLQDDSENITTFLILKDIDN